MPLAIEMRNITKAFPGVLANDRVNLRVNSQEIHCLLGENGAGKSTLMNVLFGLYQPDTGSIAINGQSVDFKGPKDAIELGLGMVHQHFMLVNRLTVLENILLGNETGGLTLDLKKGRKLISELMERYGFRLDLQAKIEDLSVGMKQRVEILKTLYRGAEIIILDEPTAVLTPNEVNELFQILQELKSKGKTIIFITHKLNETMEIADGITVLRGGQTAAELKKVDTSPEELARLMVGRDVDFDLDRPGQKPGKVILELDQVRLMDKKETVVSFQIRAGEIVGIAGVEGNGQLELEEIILGLRKPQHGALYLDGKEITRISTKERKLHGVGYIPSDRHRRAMLPNFSIQENLLLGYHFHPPFMKKGIIQKDVLVEHSQQMIENFDIRTPSKDQKIGNLSGGNQQKVIVSREVSQDPQIVVAAQPTRGLDIGAIEYIHSLLLELRSKGKAILLISAELSEIMKLSDRVGVLYEGEMMALKETESYTNEELGLLMAGEGGKHLDG